MRPSNMRNRIKYVELGLGVASLGKVMVQRDTWNWWIVERNWSEFTRPRVVAGSGTNNEVGSDNNNDRGSGISFVELRNPK